LQSGEHHPHRRRPVREESRTKRRSWNTRAVAVVSPLRYPKFRSWKNAFVAEQWFT
jgi:hypothetical protein